MDEERKAELHEKALQDDLKGYKALNKLNKSDELNTFIDLLIKTAADKMVWAFTSDNIKTWDDFLKTRGEIIAYLFPIQEIRGAETMVKHIKEQLDRFYKPSVD